MLKSVRGAVFAILVAAYVVVLTLQAFGLFTLDVWMLIGIHTVLSAAALVVVRGRIEHPATLFTFIFWFYAVGYPIVVEVGFLPDVGLTDFVVTLHTIGYLGFVLPTLLRKPTKIPEYRSVLPSDSVNVLKLGIVVLMILGTLQMVASLATDSYKGGGWKYSILATSAPRTYVVVAIAILLGQWLFSRHKLPVVLSILVVVYALIPLVITGRRTPGIIAVLVLAMLVEIRRRRLGLLKLTGIVAVGFVIMGLSKYYSTELITGAHEGEVGALVGNGWQGTVGHLFYREFKTSGRLTAASIEYGRTHNFPTYGATYLERLENSLEPAFMTKKNPNGIVRELNVYITKGGSDTGLGYSMIAEGYNNFGLPGVFFNLFALGLVASAIYRRAGRSPVWLGGYVVFMAIVCSRIRSGTLSVYVMSFYSLLLPIGLLCLVRLLLYRNYSDRIFLSRRVSG